MSNFPTVNPTDFHMTNYDSSIYSEIEEFCSKNEFTVDYFLQEFAQREQQLQRPFNAYRGRGPLNDVWNKSYCFSLLQNPVRGFLFGTIKGYTRIERMPVKSKATATPKATAPKKRRTRKTKPVLKVTTVKVAKQTTLKRPSTRNLITLERLWKDISTRWAIHRYEIQELQRDLDKAVEFVKPYHAQAVETVKQWQV